MVGTKQQILDIAMNLTRIGNWAADGYEAKQKRIELFLNQTDGYLSALGNTQFSARFAPTMQTFIPAFASLYKEAETKPADVDVWAEKMMTWGNILTHRASLLQ